MFKPKKQTFLLIEPISSVIQTRHATVRSDTRGGKGNTKKANKDMDTYNSSRQQREKKTNDCQKHAGTGHVYPEFDYLNTFDIAAASRIPSNKPTFEIEHEKHGKITGNWGLTLR